MITKAIKRWLGTLFAWWPWSKLPEANYAQAISKGNKAITQEPVWRAPGEGALPQTGITSVAVEHGYDEGKPGTSRSSAEEQQEPGEETHQANKDVGANASQITSQVHSMEASNLQEDASPSPTLEQRLAFLRYLTQRGLINEGFDKEHTPEQYKSKQ